MHKNETEAQRERLASAVHTSWSHWMQHLFTNATANSDGSVTIPAALTTRWKRQMTTEYDLLSETEKNSDRKQADKLLNAIEILEN